MTCTDSMDFSSATLADDFAACNFSLTSSAGSSRYSGSTTGGPSSCSYSDSDDYLLSASAMSYSPSNATGNTYGLAGTSSLGVFDNDPVYEFLTDDVMSGNNSTDMNLVSPSYPGQDQTQDLLTSYLPMDVLSLYSPGMMTNFSSTELSWPTRALTPPPEAYVQEVLPHHHFLSAQDFQDESCRTNQDIASYAANDMSKALDQRSERPSLPQSRLVLMQMQCSAARRSMFQPRPIRSASERSDSFTGPITSSTETRASRDEPLDKVKARSDPLYEAKADKDGWYHCPMFKKLKCTHKPTKQKCIYK